MSRNIPCAPFCTLAENHAAAINAGKNLTKLAPVAPATACLILWKLAVLRIMQPCWIPGARYQLELKKIVPVKCKKRKLSKYSPKTFERVVYQ